MKILYKSLEEINLIKQSSLLVCNTLAEIAKHIKEGITSLELDKIAETFINDNNGKPSFKGYGGFPNSLCTSKNNVVVHGIPDNVPLINGDIISVDCGVYKNGFHGDCAYTFKVGEVSEEIEKLLEVTKKSLNLGIEQIAEGKRIGDIGCAIQNYCESFGYGVVRDLVGHGLGKSLHEAPEVPNYGKINSGLKLKDGIVLAIEPMINIGTHKVKMLKDKWSIVTHDNSVSAHFEHNVAMINGKVEILSDFSIIEKELNK